jgi:hypothetical protein
MNDWNAISSRRLMSSPMDDVARRFFILFAAQNDAFIESPFPRVTLEQRQNQYFLSEHCFVKGINVGRARNKRRSGWTPIMWLFIVRQAMNEAPPAFVGLSFGLSLLLFIVRVVKRGHDSVVRACCCGSARDHGHFDFRGGR